MRRILSRSTGRKVAVMLFVCIALVLLYEVEMFDSREATPAGAVDPSAPVAGQRLAFSATAYCKGTTTASGATVRTGIAASDPALLPVGSVVSVTTDTAKYNGVYTIMDTGPKVQGRLLDIYMWSCHEALAFGRKDVTVQVLRLGWNPTQSSPSLIDRLFRRREAARRAAPAAEAPVTFDGASGATGAPEGANLEPNSALSNPAPSDVPLAPSTPIAPVAPSSSR